MASKFQKAIEDLRNRAAVQSAETVLRLKQVETDLHAKLDASLGRLEREMHNFRTEMTDSLIDGFVKFEAALTDQAKQNQENLETVLELIGSQELEQVGWREKVEERLSQLERQVSPPAA